MTYETPAVDRRSAFQAGGAITALQAKVASATHNRKLDVLAAQMRLVIGGFGLLVTALIAVFGILFTR